MLKIQQRPMITNNDRLPYPICVDKDGTIGQQSFYGLQETVILIGFQASAATDRIDLWREDWFKDPQGAVDMYPVVGDGKGGIGWLESPVGSVVEVPDVRAADIP